MSHFETVQQALAYADIGWRVLPTKGKIPILTSWPELATTDEQTIIDWWAINTGANIGIATGLGSGIIVIDVDPEGLDFIKTKSIPPTPTQRTGRGGLHFFFKHPGGHVNSDSKIFPGIDSKGDGGQVIVNPSIHESGNMYEWIISPFEQSLAEAPQWWLKAIAEKSKNGTRRRDVVKDNDTIFKGDRDEYLYSRANDLVWSGINYNPCLAALREINSSELEPAFDDKIVIQKLDSAWKNHGEAVDRKERDRIGQVAIDTFLKNDYEEKSKVALTYKKQKIHEMPNIMPDRGLIRDIAQWILDTSMLPQPLLAVAAATCFMSLIIGRKYKTQSNLRANLYMVGVASSGSGKDHARKCIKKLIELCGLQDNLGGEEVASGQAINSALSENNTKLYMIDEFGYMFQKSTDPRAPAYLRQIMTTFMKLYSQSNELYTGADYTDRKLRPQTPISEPFLTLYGTSTPGQFFDAFKSGIASSGSMARIMMVLPSSAWVAATNNFYSDPPQSLIASINKVINNGSEGNISTLDLSPNPKTVMMSDKVSAAWSQIREDLKEKILSDEISESVYNRVGENTLKLALVQAVSCGNDIIDYQEFVWARDWALWSADTMIEQYRLNAADSHIEDFSKKIERIIRKTEKDGLEHAKLKNSKIWRTLDRNTRNDIMETLIDSGIICNKSIETTTKPKTVYVHAEFAE